MPDSIWGYLNSDVYVENADGSEEGYEDMLSMARPLYEIYLSGRRGHPVSAETTASRRRREGRQAASAGSLSFLPEEEAMAAAFSASVADLMLQDTPVHKLREELGGLMSPHEARRFLVSPAVSRFAPAALKDAGVPLGRHDASIIKQVRLGGRYVEDIRVDPPGVVLRADPAGPAVHTMMVLPTAAAEQLGESSQPLWLKEVGVFWRGSALDEVVELAAELAERIGCGLWEGVWAILTDDWPRVPPITARLEQPDPEGRFVSLISLKVMPWASSKMVERAYLEARRRAVGNRFKKPGSRNLKLFEFVLRERAQTSRTGGGEPSWRELMKRWNRTHRESAYTHVRLFCRDFHRAEAAVWGPAQSREFREWETGS